MTLDQTIEALATKFARDLLTALRSASLSELTKTTAPPSPLDAGDIRPDPIRIKRRDGSVSYVGRDLLALTGLLSTRPGLRAEQIRAQLRWDRKTTTHAIKEAITEKRVTKTGQKRATRYSLATAPAA